MYGLQLLSHNLDMTHHFYSQILGFPILNRTSTYFRTQIGTTVLDFEQVDNNSVAYCFRIDLPVASFNAQMDNLSGQVTIRKRRSVFHPELRRIWYFSDPSHNIIELFPSQHNETKIAGIVMVVNESTKVSEQLQRLGLINTFTDPYRCILQNPDDATDIVLVQPNTDGNTSSPPTNPPMTIPTMKSSFNATVCVRDTPHFLYMVQSK